MTAGRAMAYQVGRLLDIDPADPGIADESQALRVARDESSRNADTPFGVWTGQDDGSELVAIAYQGQVFKS